MMKHVLRGVVVAAATLATLVGCAPAPTFNTDQLEYGRELSVPMLDKAGLGTMFTAVDRSFDTVTVRAKPDLDQLSISTPTAVQQPEGTYCTVARFADLPAQAEIVRAQSRWTGAFSLERVWSRDAASVRCTTSADLVGKSPLAAAWDKTDEFLDMDSAEYVVHIEVPLSAVEGVA